MDKKVFDWMVQECIIGYSKMSGYFYLGGFKNNIKEFGKVESEGRARIAALPAIKAFLQSKGQNVKVNQRIFECFFDTLGMSDNKEYKFEIKQREGIYTYKYYQNNEIMIDYDKVLHNEDNVILVNITSDGYVMFFNMKDYDKLEERTADKETYDGDGTKVTKLRAFYNKSKAIYTYVR